MARQISNHDQDQSPVSPHRTGLHTTDRERLGLSDWRPCDSADWQRIFNSESGVQSGNDASQLRSRPDVRASLPRSRVSITYPDSNTMNIEAMFVAILLTVAAIFFWIATFYPPPPP